MKKLPFLSLLLIAVPVWAQNPATIRPDPRRDALAPTQAPVISGTLTPTPEMWFYSQERNRYGSPRAAVRRRAELCAAARQSRLESMRWFGMSNSRPSASVTPLFGTYSPTWIGNTADPSRWRMATPAAIVVGPTTVTR